MSSEQEAIVSITLNSLSPESNNERRVVQFPHVTQHTLAMNDLRDGMGKWRIWLMLAYQDIKLRYRRSVLGPFWLTLSMAITVYSMGYLYAHLFHIELQHYFPFLVAGMLGWTLISTIITEITDGFIASDSLIKQIKLPYSLYIHRIAARNIIIFFHNILVIIPVIVYFHEFTAVNFCTLLLIPGLIAIYINAVFYGLIFAMIGARYRDVSQVIRSLVQVIFFVTPVMWGPDILKGRDLYFVSANPFYAFIEIVRQPLLGKLPTLHNLVVVSIMTFLGIIISYLMFKRYRARIVYWL